MARTFIRDLCKKKLYHKKALEEHYKVHGPKYSGRQGDYIETGYHETQADRELRSFASISSGGTAY